MGSTVKHIAKDDRGSPSPLFSAAHILAVNATPKAHVETEGPTNDRSRLEDETRMTS